MCEFKYLLDSQRVVIETSQANRAVSYLLDTEIAFWIDRTGERLGKRT